jgi:hypothetical protein
MLMVMAMIQPLLLHQGRLFHPSRRRLHYYRQSLKLKN